LFVELRGQLMEVRNSWHRIEVRLRLGISHLGLEMGQDLRRETVPGIPKEYTRIHSRNEDI